MKITGEWLDNPHTRAVCHALEKVDHRALFVGGCVRNSLLGAPVRDVDIATDARPEEVTRILKEAGFKVLPTGIDHGTVTVIAGGIPHEVTTFRHDVKTDGRRAVVAFSDSVADDARRRDFTMNALYADTSGKVIDPLDGYGDLEARRVRFIENANERIREDYLRTLRFFRFHAWYGDPQGGLDQLGLAAIAQNLDGLDLLSHERVGAEMMKLLSAPDPTQSVAAMRATGVLNRILPGGDDRALGPLVHLETQNHIAADALRRLASLGGENPTVRFRLSKKEAQTLRVLRSGVESTDSPERLGYRLGFDHARDIFLLRSALFETPLGTKALHQCKKGASAQFPVKPTDLMPEFSGPALGMRLKQLENRWIDSVFTLSASDLLGASEE